MHTCIGSSAFFSPSRKGLIRWGLLKNMPCAWFRDKENLKIRTINGPPVSPLKQHYRLTLKIAVNLDKEGEKKPLSKKSFHGSRSQSHKLTTQTACNYACVSQRKTSYGKSARVIQKALASPPPLSQFSTPSKTNLPNILV